MPARLRCYYYPKGGITTTGNLKSILNYITKCQVEVTSPQPQSPTYNAINSPSFGFILALRILQPPTPHNGVNNDGGDKNGNNNNNVVVALLINDNTIDHNNIFVPFGFGRWLASQPARPVHR